MCWLAGLYISIRTCLLAFYKKQCEELLNAKHHTNHLDVQQMLCMYIAIWGFTINTQRSSLWTTAPFEALNCVGRGNN